MTSSCYVRRRVPKLIISVLVKSSSSRKCSNQTSKAKQNHVGHYSAGSNNRKVQITNVTGNRS